MNIEYGTNGLRRLYVARSPLRRASFQLDFDTIRMIRLHHHEANIDE